MAKFAYKVSQSKVNAYRLCTQKFDYRYNQRLQPKKKARPLQFGDIAHQMVEADAEGKDPFKQLDKIAKVNRRMFAEEREMYGEIVSDTRYIMDAYFKFWEDEPLEFIKKDGRSSEIPFEIEIEDGLLVKGKLDGMVKAKRMKWLLERKSHRQFPNDDHRWRNVQSNIYLPMIKLMGWGELDGTLWDYIRSKPPTKPQLLKDGTLSTRQLDSLPQVVIDAINEYKLSLGKYRDLVKAQEDNLPSWFQRIYTPQKPKVTKSVLNDFLTTSRQMRDTKLKPVKNLGRHCDWCPFEKLCRAEMQGSDVDFVIDHEYKLEDDNNDREETD